MESSLIWIPLLPFLGFLLNGLFGKKFGPKFVSWVGFLAPASAFFIAVNVFRALAGDHGDGHGHDHAAGLHQHLFDWIQVGNFSAPFGLLADNITSIMCLVITGVGSLIHLYSIEYMKGDKGYYRFFAYLNLFTSFMLLLVLGDNLLLMFVGWEGVGLCSYLLIGFWFEERPNASAGQKAFVVNRIGDFGVLLAIFLCQKFFGTIDTRELIAAVSQSLEAAATIANAAPGFTPGDETLRLAGILQSFGTDGVFWGLGLLDWIALLFFVGATGKSAQIPLYVWLPDAMAGPTPVSALIHAATMVTSGIYLCCRLMPIFEASEFTLHVIAAIGASTALLAALIALSQNDIKKVLAYSTVSQLGYMFFAIGMGAFGAAFFHVVTHAFFKALLFLGSGSVIHAMHHEQDMRKMGGLKRQLPVTYWTYMVGTLAIAGVPVFAGFFSKDEILFAGFHNAFGHEHSSFAMLFWGISVLTAGLTAFYMLRSVAMTFWGESRVDAKLLPSVHEPGWRIRTPLLVLAVLAAIGGFLGVPEFLGGHNWIGHFTGLHHGHGEMTEAELHAFHQLEWTSLVISVLVGVAGLAAAWYMYGAGKSLLTKLVVDAPLGRRLRRWSENKFYVDEFYDFFVKGFHLASHLTWALVDQLLIDKILVEGSAAVTKGTGHMFRRMQSGFIPAYLLTFGAGALVLIFMLLLKDAGN